jgi:hypothetical protein
MYAPVKDIPHDIRGMAVNIGHSPPKSRNGLLAMVQRFAPPIDAILSADLLSF